MQYTSCTGYNNTSPLLSAIPMPGMSSALDNFAYDNNCTNLINSSGGNGDDGGGGGGGGVMNSINETRGYHDLLLS